MDDISLYDGKDRTKSLTIAIIGRGFFDTGPHFVFNLNGGGPGIRVNQFGGGRPRTRPNRPAATEDTPLTLRQILSNFLPLLLLVILPVLSTFFSASSTPSGPKIRFETPSPPYTMHRITPRLKVDYYINPLEVEDWSNRKLHQLDQSAEVDFVRKLRIDCEIESENRQRLVQDAQGWFMIDQEKMAKARRLPMKNCNRLDELRIGRGV